MYFSNIIKIPTIAVTKVKHTFSKEIPENILIKERKPLTMHVVYELTRKLCLNNDPHYFANNF